MRNILGWIKKWEVLKTDATFDVDAEIAALDAAETDNQGILAKYNNWVGHGTNFIERLDKWKKDGGKYFSEEAVKIYLQSIKDSLESVGWGLDPVEQNELDQITYYIEHGEAPMEKILTVMDWKSALGVKVNVFNSLVQQWVIFNPDLFKKSVIKIKEIVIVDKVNTGKINEANLIKYCKETLAKKPELMDDIYEVPENNADKKAWLEWFLTRDPETVVKTIALREIKKK